MIGFDATDDEKMLRDSVAQFAARTLRPRMREFERVRGACPTTSARPRTVWASPWPPFRPRSAAAGLGVVDADAHRGRARVRRSRRGLRDRRVRAPTAGRRCLFGGMRAARDVPRRLRRRGGRTRAFGAVAWGEKQGRERTAGPDDARGADDGRLERSPGEKAYVLQRRPRAELHRVRAGRRVREAGRGSTRSSCLGDAHGLTVLPRHATLGLDAASFGGIALEGVEVPDAARLGGGVTQSRASWPSSRRRRSSSRRAAWAWRGRRST